MDKSADVAKARQSPRRQPITRVRWLLYIAPRADVPRTLAINDDVANAAASSESERDPDKEEKFENENQVGDEGCPSGQFSTITKNALLSMPVPCWNTLVG